jgi:hypothetical protein
LISPEIPLPIPRGKHSAIVIITDGENHEDDAVESAAKEAAEAGIKVYTIGMGSAEGAPIPIYSNGAVVGFKQDNSRTNCRHEVESSEMLTEIAERRKWSVYTCILLPMMEFLLVLKELNASG